MAEILFITLDEARNIHEVQINIYGGLHGIRDEGLLDSAINAPQSSFEGNYLYSDIYHMASAYMHFIIKNHAFLDGNKRTGSAVALVFLKLNKITLTLAENELFECTLKVATSKLSLEDLAKYFKDNSYSS